MKNSVEGGFGQLENGILSETPFVVESLLKLIHFHSLRHTFITNLSRANVSPKVAQQLARHSDIPTHHEYLLACLP